MKKKKSQQPQKKKRDQDNFSMEQDWFDQVSSDEQDFMDYYRREEEWINSLDFRDHEDN